MSDKGIVALSPDQLEVLAALVARHLAAALAHDAADELIDAAEVARRHGVSRAWVYDHADRLGAIRLGDGGRPRLRFNPARVTAALARAPASPRAVSGPTRRRPNTTSSGAPLLPIATDEAA